MFFWYTQHMKLKLPLRIILIFFLITAFAGLVINVNRALQESVLGLSYGLDEPLGFIGFLGNVLLTVFIAIVVMDLARDRAVSRTACTVSFIISAVTAVIFSYFVYSLAQDALGVYCTALFGLQSSCIAAPLMILMYVIFNPFVLAVMGLAALSGTVTQLKARKRAPLVHKK